MKAIIALFLLALLTGCATPYYPVYSGNPGDYYIPESETTAYYDPYAAVYEGSEPGSLGYIGMAPWWGYSYYSPYFYPHHFSVWYPRSRFDYGRYSGYYPYWCPPYRSVASRRPVSSPPPIEAPSLVAPTPSAPVAPVSAAPDVIGGFATAPDVFVPRQGDSPAVLVRAPTVSSNSTPIRRSTGYPHYGYSRSTYSNPYPASSFSGRSMGSATSSRGSGFSSPTSRSVRSAPVSRPSIHKQ